MAAAGLFLLYKKLKSASLEKWKIETAKTTKIGLSLKALWPLIATCSLIEFLVGLTWNAYADGLPHDPTILTIAALVVFVAVIVITFAARRLENMLKIYQCFVPLIAAACVLVAYVLIVLARVSFTVSFGVLTMGFIGIEISTWITLSAVSGNLSMPASILFGIRGLTGSIGCVLGIILASFITSNTIFIGFGISIFILVLAVVGAMINTGRKSKNIA
jgi:hypothetical protein